MKMLLVLLCFMTTDLVKGGYYKIRPPSPPPNPPPSLHYGPHPPSHHHHSHHPYRIHPPYPPMHHLPPPHLHSHHPHSRVPHIPHIHHKSSPYSREFHKLPPYPQKIPLPSPYKPFNTFRAPIVKETFNPPPTQYVPTYIRDDERGPIHTIPAPNLGPSDMPHLFFNQNPIHVQDHQDHHPKQSSEDDLVAVLKHGIQKVNIPHKHAYQVSEDPSLHHPNSDKPSFFAPDPDPSVPAVKVPATSDPHSIPSNGQVPLDIYLQQQADKIEAQHHQTTDNSNVLTAQDLFNLLNYQQGSTVNTVQQPQLNQHSQPNVQFYNSGQEYQGEQNAQFSPHFQSFNYDEQTQQGSYGSNSNPLGLLNTDVTGSGHHFEDFKDNDLAGSERDEVYHKLDENEIVPPQPESKKKSVDKKEQEYKINIKQNSPTPYYKPTTPTTVKTTTVNVATKQEISEEKTETTKETSNTKESKISPKVEIVKPEENVQLQKSIQIYENTYHETSPKEPTGSIELKDFSGRKEGKTGRGLVVGEIIPETISNQADVGGAQIPFGTRLRPKRY